MSIGNLVFISVKLVFWIRKYLILLLGDCLSNMLIIYEYNTLSSFLLINCGIISLDELYGIIVSSNSPN
jgi:hypothetical protein